MLILGCLHTQRRGGSLEAIWAGHSNFLNLDETQGKGIRIEKRSGPRFESQGLLIFNSQGRKEELAKETEKEQTGGREPRKSDPLLARRTKDVIKHLQGC